MILWWHIYDIFFAVLFPVHSLLDFIFIVIWRLFPKHLCSNIAKKIHRNINSREKWRLISRWRIYHESSSVLLFCLFSTKFHFHCCLALVCFIISIPVLFYFRLMYLQKFTQHHNTTSATTNNRLSTALVIYIFTLISYNIL